MKAILWLLLYSFVLLFFLSPDSYLYDLYYRIDTACFFMCGKAWMCGMVPYVDFTDSKGPLLWLIYGVGYLISHHSYIGVFWISILFYTATLFTAYKLCRLFADKDVSAVSVAALPFFLLYFSYHFEVRAEDFCYPFVMLALYCTCRILKYRDSNANTYFKLSILMGVCSMCCVLIKYNIGCMIMTLMTVVLYMAIRHKAGWQSFWGMVIGFVVPAVPFVICFLIYGNMGAFIQEYFINSLQTSSGTRFREFTGIHFQRSLFFKIVIFIMFIYGIWHFSKKYKLGYWLIPVFILCILGLGGLLNWGYYYSILMPFSIFLVYVVFDFMLNKYSGLKKHIVLLSVVTAVCAIGIDGYFLYKRNIMSENDTARKNYYSASYVISQVSNPKIMFWGLDYGIGLPAGTLPACKYWMKQNGATDDMIAKIDSALKNSVADFVCIKESNKEKMDEIELYGYVFYCESPCIDSENKTDGYYVFGRPGLKLPPEDFHVSQWDVWLKRNIFGI